MTDESGIASVGGGLSEGSLWWLLMGPDGWLLPLKAVTQGEQAIKGTYEGYMVICPVTWGGGRGTGGVGKHVWTRADAAGISTRCLHLLATWLFKKTLRNTDGTCQKQRALSPKPFSFPKQVHSLFNKIWENSTRTSS